jgi:glutathione S-transferase
MVANTLNVLKPSVNNLTARIFVRAAGLEFEELDVWGKTTTPEFLQKYPAHLTPMLEEEGLPRTPASGRWSTARCST